MGKQYKQFTNINLLRRFDFELLLRFLTPYRDYLCSKPGFCWTDNLLMFPYQELSQILMCPDDEMPEDLHTALFFIDELSGTKSSESLLSKLKHEGVLPKEPLAQTDLALYAWMRDPALLESFHTEQHMLRVKRYETCYSKKVAWPDLSRDALIALEDALNDWFDSLQKGRGVQVMVYERGDAIWFHLRHGELLKRDGALNNNGMTRRIVYRPERYDNIVFTPTDCELRIHAQTKREKGAYCRFIGKHLLNDERFFIFGDSTARYTLAPLKDQGRSALVCSDVDGMVRVALLEAHVNFPGSRKYRETYKSETDLFTDWETQARLVPEKAEFVRASFQLHFVGSTKPRLLTVCTPDVTIFERGTETERVVAWMRNRRFAI